MNTLTSSTGTTTLANLTNYKLQVGQAIYNLPNNFQIAPNQGCRIYTSVIPSEDAPAPYNGCGGKFSFSNIGYPTGNPTGIWPNTAGTRVELRDSANVVVASLAIKLTEFEAIFARILGYSQ